jgi:hypothetical protein
MPMPTTQSFVMVQQQQQLPAVNGLYAGPGVPHFPQPLAQQDDMLLQHHEYLHQQQQLQIQQQQQSMYPALNALQGQVAPTAYAPSPIYRHGYPYI